MGIQKPKFDTSINISNIIAFSVVIFTLFKFEMEQAKDVTANKVQIQANKEVIATMAQNQSDINKTFVEIRRLFEQHINERNH